MERFLAAGSLLVYSSAVRRVAALVQIYLLTDASAYAFVTFHVLPYASLVFYEERSDSASARAH